MKKIFLMIIIFLVSASNVKASTIEEQLNELKTNINKLQSSMNDIKDNTLDKTYPVGSIYITTVYSTSSQVSEALGGTWEAYSSGRTLVGVDSSDETFNTVGKEGGNSTTTLSTDNLPSHTHSIPALTGKTTSAGTHTHNNTAKSSTISGQFGVTVPGGHGKYATGSFTGITIASNVSAPNFVYTTNTIYGYELNATPTITMENASAGAHTHTITTSTSTLTSAGNMTAFTNLQEYITVYIYKRIS